MAGGWTRDGAVLDQIDDTILDGVLTARARMPAGEGTEDCIECGDPIPEARRRAIPGVTTCVPCQSGRDSRVVVTGINRRGSKDSQLR
ncbi:MULTISPECIES: DksA/TraR family C4-type zinc finger protein [Brevundimonas]|jgi:phage/conjugal plasmid C-4 type zinc finger TraR family protein|uniref:DksA/TraR family C4-type zinc finger protein n=1 Tax=Brevundimonas vesicularis TaxID=41276 RepID=A0ABU4KR57_BREVE|nr:MULTISPECIES: DksA/TraR family C4-type zinc finger protein [Brevundimonas]MDX2335279.1 DksA/TraR family C4-type zinc finger protein [Brevundimonas vesicularis]HBI20952.1 DksA/TraR family C4-type zinc finger protein [Brevundimonas sp.]